MFYDQIQVSFNFSYLYFLSKNSNTALDKDSRLLKSDIPPQDQKIYAVELLLKFTEIPKNILWVLNGFRVVIWMIGYDGTMRLYLQMRSLTFAVHLGIF